MSRIPLAALAALLTAACGGTTEPKANEIPLPATPVTWAVTSDTVPLFSTPGISNAKFVSHVTKANAVVGGATLAVSCTFSYDGLVTDPPRTTVSMELTSGFFDSQFPLILGTWTPSSAGAYPALTWQVPTAKPWVAGMSDQSQPIFLETIKSRTGVKWTWVNSGSSAVDVVFDIRGLPAAVATISSRCKR